MAKINYTIEEVRNHLQQIVDELSKSGMSFEWIEYQPNPEYSIFRIKYMNEDFGEVKLRAYELREYGNFIGTICFYTKIEMTTKSSFTKTSLQNKCSIRLTNYRTYDEQDTKKCSDWLTLLAKEYKTIQQKKKEFEMKVDFL